MAIRVANRTLADTQPRTAVGIKLPFSAGDVFTSTYTTGEQLKYNIQNFFSTTPGERYMNPGFGGGLRDIIFENLDEETFDLARQRIETDITTYFPNVEILGLDVYSNQDTNQLLVKTTYRAIDLQVEDTLTIII